MAQIVVLFSGDYYHKYINVAMDRYSTGLGKGRVSSPYPRQLSFLWPPWNLSSVDAAINALRKTYIFKNDQFYRVNTVDLKVSIDRIRNM